MIKLCWHKQKDTQMTRYFKCAVLDKDGEVKIFGRYSGIKPKQVAAKAFSRVHEHVQNKDFTSGKTFFALVECTRGEKHKVYYYSGVRQKLETPETLVVKSGHGDKTISYSHMNIIDRVVDTSNEILPIKKFLSRDADENPNRNSDNNEHTPDTKAVVPQSPKKVNDSDVKQHNADHIDEQLTVQISGQETTQKNYC
ncbi:hypothetical protein YASMINEVIRUS_1569 [Yasminevirus sp. GU-2018]|uniref:Uncharacterized protein n=1 Tax=Yasminevirus sp. GU-2018 TaxID=2420051 RepID=A0A5K0UAK6_9VIRU|nr:hypothetical protein YASMINEVIRUS_1569 [Yasminevirus sp. GU-2018]